jgi:hypothetical protein
MQGSIWHKIGMTGIFLNLFFPSYTVIRSPFEVYLPYLFIIFFLPFFAVRFRFPFYLVPYFFVLLVSGILAMSIDANTAERFLKIFVNFIVFALFYHYVFEYFEQKVEKPYKYYLIFAGFSATILLIQVISYFAKFKYGYDFRWFLNKWGYGSGGLGIRFNGLFSEPSHYAAALAPAFFTALYNLFLCPKGKRIIIKSLWGNALLFFTYFLPFSSVGFLGIFVMLIILMIQYGVLRYASILLPLAIVGHLFLYNQVEDYQDRINGMADLFAGKGFQLGKTNGSSFILYNNAHIAYENLADGNFLLGTGLGSHYIAAQKYSLTKQYGDEYASNYEDANSMLIRLFSETGILGVIFFIGFLIKNFVKKLPDNSNAGYWVVNSSCLVLIVLQLLRQGNYTYNGFFFYLFLYYYSHANYQKKWNG